MTNKKSILAFHFPYSSELGGQENQINMLFDSLRKNKHDIKCVGYKNEVLINKLKQDGYNVFKINMAKPPVTGLRVISFLIQVPLSMWTYAKIIWQDRKRINVIILISLGEKILVPFIIALFRLFKIVDKNTKIIWLEHGSARVNRYLSHNPFRPALILSSKISKIITPSKQNASYLRELGMQNINVINNAVKDINQKRTKSKKIRITYAGRLDPNKGIIDLIDAFNLLCKKNKNLQMNIFGDGKYKKELKKYARKIKLANEISFHGFDNIRTILKQTDISVLPSSSPESFGLWAAESMMSSIPVIVTTQCGISDWIKYRENGITVEPNNSTAMANEINKLINSKRLQDQIGNKARLTAIKHFSEEENYQKYISLLK